MEGQPKRLQDKKLVVWIGILAGVVTILAFFSPQVARIQNNHAEFVFQFDGVSDQDKPVYEITEDIHYVDQSYIDNNDWIEAPTEITITPRRKGNIVGKVFARLQVANGESIQDNSWTWTEFQNTYKESRTLTLSPNDLYKYSGITAAEPEAGSNYQKGVYTYAPLRGEFTIEIVDGTDKVLDSRIVEVVLTPWYHTTRILDNEIQAHEDVIAIVDTVNIGEPSDFRIIGYLYDLTSRFYNVGSHTDVWDTLITGNEGWWPAKTWDTTCEVKEPVKLGLNEKVTTKLLIPADCFEAKHIYVLITFAAKRLDYLHFDGQWENSLDIARTADSYTYSTIVVLEP